MTKDRFDLADLIDAFFDALDVHRQFDQAASIIQDLYTVLGSEEASLWATYFTGILAEEKDRDWAKAEACYTQVLAQTPPPLLQAQIFLSLGIAYDKQGRWDDAVGACDQSILHWQALKDSVKLGLALRQLAIVYCNGFDSGDYSQAVLPKAKALCQRALGLFVVRTAAADVAPIPFYTAATWQVLGRAFAGNGEYTAAIGCYEHYRQLAQTHHYAFHVGFAQWNLAICLHLNGQWASALINYEEAQGCFAQLHDTYHQFRVLAHKGALYHKLGQKPQAIACFTESLALMERVRTGISTEAVRSSFFTTVVSIFDQTILLLLAQDDFNGAFDCAERARARSFLEALRQDKRSIAPHLEANPATLQELQAIIPAEALVLAYYTTKTSVAKAGNDSTQSLLFSVPTTILFAITQDAIELFMLPVAPDELVLPLDGAQIEQLLLPSAIRRRLYEKLLAPVETMLRGKQRLYLIPHGPLHAIPFHALIAPDGETLLREDGPEIVYAPSATILFRERQKQRSSAPGSCLAVGYNGDEGLELHFAEQEAAYIALMAQGTALIGAVPKKAALYAQAPDYRALHFSCHGEFDPDAPLQSLLHIGPGETLTGQEIMDNLRLNCNLVTLSACESGLSKVQRGDELYGLIRAFMYAGAPAIIATLWQVDERSTLVFAEKFYALIEQGVPYATALKAGQLYLRNVTRKEALLILSRHLAQQPGADGASPLWQAQQYVKSFAAQATLNNEQWHTHDPLAGEPWQGEQDTEQGGEQDTEQIFADPKFWAPFVLIGDPQIGRA